MPPQPTAAATAAAIRPRHERAVAGLDLWVNSAAIDNALKPSSNSWKYRKQHGFLRSAIAAPAKQPYRAALSHPSTKSRKQGGKAMPASRTIAANGIDISVLEQGEGPLVLLCHGWPELSYSSRHQIPALAAAGFHVAAPGMRGFGRTTAPADVAACSIVHTG